jgi:hypothetical protein
MGEQGNAPPIEGLAEPGVGEKPVDSELGHGAAV